MTASTSTCADLDEVGQGRYHRCLHVALTGLGELRGSGSLGCRVVDRG